MSSSSLIKAFYAIARVDFIQLLTSTPRTDNAYPKMTSKPNSSSSLLSDKTMNTPLLFFPAPCKTARFLRRYKRFSIETLLDNTPVWVHSNNSGAMLGLLRRGAPALLSPAENPKRRLRYTLEALWVGKSTPDDSEGFWTGVNTLTPNRLLKAAFAADLLPFVRHAEGYDTFTAEVRHGASRVDGLIQGKGVPDIWVECKNVTLCEENTALFPDAATTRGQKHLCELISLVQSGARAVMLYVIERPDCSCFSPAECIDPEYARLFFQAMAAGVEMCPVMVDVTEQGIFWNKTIPVRPRD